MPSKWSTRLPTRQPQGSGMLPRMTHYERRKHLADLASSNHTSGGHGHGHGHGQTNPLLYSSKSHQKFRHGTPPDQSHVKVIQSRPKPRCWDHGCNGRQFSTFSNLLRHQREKSGQATKSTCPNCGAEFTRTTARNGHLMHDKCKRRNA